MKIEALTGIKAVVDDPELLTNVRIIFSLSNRDPYHALTVQMTPR